MFKKFLKEYFSFSKSEKYGVLTLVGIIIILLSLKILLPQIITKPKQDHSEFIKEIEEFKQSLSKSSTKVNEYSIIEEVSSDRLFYFDPNTVSNNELKALGLNKKQINTILKYRSKGGVFYKKEDLKKIYGISKEEYYKLEPYIIIKKESKSKEYSSQDNSYYFEEKKLDLIKINSSLAIDLKKVDGIGDVLSKRIIKYRDRLGGFVSKEQLKEVYGITDSAYVNLFQSIIIDSTNISKIDLNTCNIEKLQDHPYINTYQAKAIISYRDFKDKITSVDEIHKNHLLSEESFQKVKSYFVIK